MPVFTGKASIWVHCRSNASASTAQELPDQQHLAWPSFPNSFLAAKASPDVNTSRLLRVRAEGSQQLPAPIAKIVCLQHGPVQQVPEADACLGMKTPICGRPAGTAALTHAGSVRGRHPSTSHNAVEVPAVLCIIKSDHLRRTSERA